MKPYLAAAALALFSAQLPAAETTAGASLSSTDRIALDCLTRDITDERLAPALAQQGIGAGAMLDRIKARLKNMRLAKAEGIDPTSKWFWARVEELDGKGFPAAAPALAPPPAPAPPPVADSKTVLPDDEIDYDRLRVDERALSREIDRAMVLVQAGEAAGASEEAKKKCLEAAEKRKLLDLQVLENRAQQESLVAKATLERAVADAKAAPANEALKAARTKAQAALALADRSLAIISAEVKRVKDGPAEAKDETKVAPVVRAEDKPAYEILLTEEAALKTQIATFGAIASSATSSDAEKKAARKHLDDLDTYLGANTEAQAYLRAKLRTEMAQKKDAAASTPQTRDELATTQHDESQAERRSKTARTLAVATRNSPPDDPTSTSFPKARSKTHPQLLEEEMNLKEAFDQQSKLARDHAPTGSSPDPVKMAAASSKLTEIQAKRLENRANQLRLRAAADHSSLSTTTKAAPKLAWLAQDDLEATKRREEETTAIHKTLEEKLNAQANDPRRTPFAFTHGGLRMQAPYVLTLERLDDPASDDPAKTIPGDYTLSSEGTKVGGFLEFVYTNIWAWRPGRQLESKNALKDPEGARFQYVGAGLLKNLQKEHRMGGFINNAWDTMGRVSFEFGEDDKPSASTITGSGDFNAEITFDKHLLRGFSRDDNMAFTGSLSVTVGGVTDKSTFEVHPRLMGGLALAMSFDDPFSALAVPRKVWYRMQGGVARIDSLQFADHTSMKIKSSRPGVPLYETDRSALALETELFWPIREGGLVSLGTRLYGKVTPSPWSLYLSVTIPLAPIIDNASPK